MYEGQLLGSSQASKGLSRHISNRNFGALRIVLQRLSQLDCSTRDRMLPSLYPTDVWAIRRIEIRFKSGI